MQLYTYTKNVLTAANSITLQLLELVTPCCNLLVGIMALFSINGRSGTPVLYAPLKIQKCNLKGVVLFFSEQASPTQTDILTGNWLKNCHAPLLGWGRQLFFAIFFVGHLHMFGDQYWPKLLNNPYFSFANGNAIQ